MSTHLDQIAEINPEAKKIDGFDDCIIGIAERCGLAAVLAYDQGKIIEKLESQGIEHDEAVEYFEFNILGAWVGDGTPIFVDTDN